MSDYNSYKLEIKLHRYQADISKQNEEYGSKLEREYEPISIKNEELSRKKEEEEYSRKVRYGVPFVGMRERDIGNTTLGKPSDKVRHNYDYSRGERTRANLYDFCNYYGKVIFIARCVNGVVKQVWDERKEAQVNPYPAKKPTNPTTSKKFDSDVDEFGDAEDYYDWYYDDYYDFEDAEEYFDEYD